MREAMRLTTDPGWVLDAPGYDPLREHGIELRLAISNGFLGVRASRTVGRGPTWLTWQNSLSWASWPRTYRGRAVRHPEHRPAGARPGAGGGLAAGRHPARRRGAAAARAAPRCRTTGGSTCGTGCCWPSGGSGCPREWTRECARCRLVSQAERALGLQFLPLELDRDDVEVTLEACSRRPAWACGCGASSQELGVWRTTESGKAVAMAGDGGADARRRSPVRPTRSGTLRLVSGAGARWPGRSPRWSAWWRWCARDTRRRTPAPPATAALARARRGRRQRGARRACRGLGGALAGQRRRHRGRPGRSSRRCASPSIT